MKTILSILIFGLLVTVTFADDIVVRKVQGEVSVRHGVEEVWSEVAVGDVLRPSDTIRTGKRGRAVLAARIMDGESPVPKTITLPSRVIMDMSDLRNLSQEDLMLKLTMEKVRASSYEWKKNEMNIPNTTVVHGTNRAPSSAPSEEELDIGVFQLNGTRVLYDNKFYATCALKSMEILRRFPPLKEQLNNRLIVAEALEKLNLRSEALNEYVALSSLEGITNEQEAILRDRIAKLKSQAEQ